jgi:hypothetical protein
MSECVGCGYCCMKTPCDAARRLYPGVTECPQLEWIEDKGRYVCGLMMLPGLLGENYRKELHAGAGCCAGLNTWRKDVKKRISTTSLSYTPIPRLMQTFIRCLGHQFISGDVIALTIAQMASELSTDGYSDDEIANITKAIKFLFIENRNSFTRNFMG